MVSGTEPRTPSGSRGPLLLINRVNGQNAPEMSGAPFVGAKGRSTTFRALGPSDRASKQSGIAARSSRLKNVNPSGRVDILRGCDTAGFDRPGRVMPRGGYAPQHGGGLIPETGVEVESEQ